MNQKEIKIGDIVKYIGNRHDDEPEYYPTVGTTGVAKYIGISSIRVQWEEGSTSGDDCWYCGYNNVEVVSSASENKESKRVKLGRNMVGKKVRLVNKEEHYYTVPNESIGTIIDFDENDDIAPYQVKWESDKISWVFARDIEEVKSNPIPEMTNEEIWEMLESKMRKNGLKRKMGALYCGNNLTNGYWVYTLDDVHNAIALAYKVGYLRAMKGRHFKIGEKKKKGGHWVPVDVKEIPKAGYKITNNGIDWGYEYIGTYKKGHDGRFYQWVEDDE